MKFEEGKCEERKKGRLHTKVFVYSELEQGTFLRNEYRVDCAVDILQ